MRGYQNGSLTTQESNEEINICKNCYQDNKKTRSLPDKNYERDIRVCAFVEANGPMSSSEISQEVGIPARTVRYILKKHGYQSYKIKTT